MFNQISVSNNQAVDSHPTLSTQKVVGGTGRSGLERKGSQLVDMQ